MADEDLIKQVSRLTIIIGRLDQRVTEMERVLKHVGIRLDYLTQALLDDDVVTIRARAEELINEIEAIGRLVRARD